ncbi:MAG: PKD domain-containing protein [Candidatus Eisenbacteria bacterium]
MSSRTIFGVGLLVLSAVMLMVFLGGFVLAGPKTPLTINVKIDIKPGSYPNAIYTQNSGVIPVAILTTRVRSGEPVDFDATKVDPTSGRFGPSAAREIHGKGHIQDVDGDRDLDMVFHFETLQTGIQPGDREACLTAKTLSGDQVRGCDAIVTVPPLSVTAKANPTAGYLPLAVSFTAATVGVIVLYEWDFDGDGVYDASSNTSPATTHTYETEGIYNATIQVTSRQGLKVRSAVQITVLAYPAATALADPTSGYYPLTVSFSASTEGTIVLYEWDFDGDGLFDWSSDTSPVATYTYMAEGTYYAAIQVTDPNGLTAIDDIAITVMTPLSVTAEADPTSGYYPLAVSFSASTVGTIALYEWDFDGDGVFDWSSATSPAVTRTYMADGTYNAVIRVTNPDGLTAVDDITITTLKPLHAIARAAPTSGVRPLNVQFLPGGDDAAGTIIRYQWDYDGNGTWDWTHVLPDVTSRSYTVAGAYNAVLKVTDNNGVTDTAIVAITVRQPPPTVSASASPTNGPVPLIVSFDGSATSSCGTISLYEWDFESDGTYDWSSAVSASTGYTYPNQGVYYAELRVTDTCGSTASSTVVIIAQPPGSPTVTARATPTSGPSPLGVSFEGSATSPNGAITLYEWDFQNDGLIDWSSPTTGNTNYTYVAGGTYDAVLKVTDVAGAIGYGSVRVTVNIILSLTRDPDSFYPSSGQTTTVTTTYSGAGAISIWVKNRMGEIVRRLVTGENRTAGTYNDVWDGTDDDGGIVPDDSYYFVAEARMPGNLTQLYDITGTGITGTRRAIGGSVATFPRNFSPWEDQFSVIGYNVPVAGEVTADICPLDYDGERIKALIGREPQTRGAHTVIWDGTNDAGNLIIGGNWLVTIWSYDLTGNGVVTGGNRPSISNVSANPNYYDPSYHADEPVGFRNVEVAYSLSERADVTLRVFDFNYNLIRTIRQGGVDAGTHSLAWDGRNFNGELCTDKKYRLALSGADSESNQSVTMYTFVALFY